MITKTAAVGMDIEVTTATIAHATFAVSFGNDIRWAANVNDVDNPKIARIAVAPYTVMLMTIFAMSIFCFWFIANYDYEK